MIDARTIRGRRLDLNVILKRIHEKRKKQSHIIIGIDGCGGADFIIDDANNEITNK